MTKKPTKTRWQRWIALQPRGTGAQLCRTVPISHTTLATLARGGRLSDYALASRLAAHTSGALTPADICEGK